MRLKIRDFLSRLQAVAVWSRVRSVYEPYVVPVRTALAPYWQQAAAWYQKREPRERLLLRLLGGFVAILFLQHHLSARAWLAR